ncbi:MAG: hypothetical protein U0636_06470 [Phycisphaerales bacterium]
MSEFQSKDPNRPAQDGALNASAAGGDPLYLTLEWVLRSLDNPAIAASDWVAQEVDPSRPTAVALLTDPTTPLSRLVRARTFYLALRTEGSNPAERTMAGRMALAASAAALLFHGEHTSPHDDQALAEALAAAQSDAAVPSEIRSMLGLAARRLGSR